MDNEIKIVTSEDEMFAYILFHHDRKRKLSIDHLKRILLENGIIYGIDEERLKNLVYLLKTGSVEYKRYMIAKGKKAEDGEDAGLLLLRPSDDGTVLDAVSFDYIGDRIDYKCYMQKEYVSIKKGGMIGFYLPPTDRENGITVRGTDVSAKDGSNLHLELGDNVYMKHNKIYSKIDGVIDYRDKNNTVFLDVTDIYVVDGDVNYSTGNIDFSGKVIVKGDIFPGFVVDAGGDVIVAGSVHCGQVYSGRNISIGEGVIGHEDGIKSICKAEGHIKARYVQYSILFSQENIVVYRSVVHSELYSNKSVAVLGDPGSIIGGTTVAMYGIESNIIGAEIAKYTKLVTGVIHENFIKNATYVKSLEELFLKRTKYNHYLGEHHSNMMDNSVKKVSHKYTTIYKNKLTCDDEIIQLEDKISTINKNIRDVSNSKVEFFTTAFPGVIITIDGISYEVKQKYSSGYFCLNKDGESIQYIKNGG